MNLTKRIASVLAIAATLGTAHAAQTGGWKEVSKAPGVRAGEFVSAPQCEAGAYPVATVSLEMPVGSTISRDMTYALQKELNGWRLTIVSATTLAQTPALNRETSTVATYCAL